jgi:hypothetical protein
MAQKPKSKDRQITIGGKKLTIIFGFRASLALQDKWGCETDEALFERMSAPKQKMSDFIDILWASCRTHHPDVTTDELIALIDEAGAEGVAEAVQQAISAAQVPSDAKKKPQAQSQTSR